MKEEDSGLEHLIVSMQPRKYSEDYSKHPMEFQIDIPKAVEVLEDVSRTTRCLQDTRLRRARGLVRPGAKELLIGVEYSRVRDSTWNVPYPFLLLIQ